MKRNINTHYISDSTTHTKVDSYMELPHKSANIIYSAKLWQEAG